MGGPRVIDVNGRMGGFYIRDWVLEIWDYDLLAAAARCSTGTQPEPSTSEPQKYIAGAMLLPSVHGMWLSDPANRRRLRNISSSKGAILLEFEEEVHGHDLVDEPWGNLATGSRSALGAVGSLVELWHATGLTDPDPDLVNLLPRFEGYNE
jgi:carnosine synthase